MASNKLHPTKPHNSANPVRKHLELQQQQVAWLDPDSVSQQIHGLHNPPAHHSALHSNHFSTVWSQGIQLEMHFNDERWILEIVFLPWIMWEFILESIIELKSIMLKGEMPLKQFSHYIQD